MEVFHSIAEWSRTGRPAFWAMGFFDGVHRGHRRVISAVPAGQHVRGVLTFESHPLEYLRPERAPRLLTPSWKDKAALLETLGVDAVLCLPFTAELAATEPEDFLGQLAAGGRLAGVSVGENWHFGRGGRGDTAFLRQQGEQLGFRCVVNDMAQTSAGTVSSSAIRRLLAEGELEAAAEMLGRPFCLSGVVEHGQALARKLGFPTANIRVSEKAAVPPSGVYEVSCCPVEGEPARRGIANLGLRPTIQEDVKQLRLEVHLPGWEGDLYGRQLRVELLRFMRPEQRFGSVEELRAAIARDLAQFNAGA